MGTNGNASTDKPATDKPAGSDSGSTSGTDARAYGHGSRESDIAKVTNAHAGEARARDARTKSTARTIRSTVEGEPPMIDGETVAEMRARVARERADAAPTAFERSLVGRRPGEARPGIDQLTGTSSGGGVAADVNVAAGNAGTAAAGAGTAGTAGTGTMGTGTTGTTGGAR